jgi:hypothetical protein
MSIGIRMSAWAENMLGIKNDNRPRTKVKLEYFSILSSSKAPPISYSPYPDFRRKSNEWRRWQIGRAKAGRKL